MLGRLWHDVAVFRSMTDCRYCKTKVSREATRCPNCQEGLNGKEAAQEAVEGYGNTLAATESVKGNLAKLRLRKIAIVALVVLVGIGLLSGVRG